MISITTLEGLIMERLANFDPGKDSDKNSKVNPTNDIPYCWADGGDYLAQQGWYGDDEVPGKNSAETPTETPNK